MKTLSNNDLLFLLNSAITAAHQAGHLLAIHANRDISVQSKTAGESLASQVVTDVDCLCQEVILKALLPTCEMYDIALLTEESDDNKMRLQKDFFWSVDPLDGTLPFIESTSGYAVSIALLSRSGIPFIGVIYDPIEQMLYHAIKGSGAFRNKQPWILKHPSAPEKLYLTIVSDRSFIQYDYYKKVMQKLEALAVELGLNGLKTIQHGGAVMNACWVLENTPGCYFKFPKLQNGGGSLWDYAATSCLFNEIGAIVSDIYGQPLDLNRPDSTFMNHRGILYASNQNIAERVRDIYNNI